ncbi:MAG: transglutaminase domain-containing protein [Dehalococcoidales bacterium]|jgi:hypothetical protein|nr:transglutaminase domain-containing protein [Dehalococcoidales bacterium]
MRKSVVVTLLIVILGLASPALAAPSDGFFERGDDIYDSFGISRNRSVGEDGFFQLSDDNFDPIIARESMGTNTDIAWELGLSFAEKYPDHQQRAREIFNFVRDKLVYTSDIDEFGRDEFAQNADEVLETIIGNGRAPGDCEDGAVLLAVMYKAAGFRSAIALAPGHAATVVYLPDYPRAAHVFTLEGQKGWIWAETTGNTNELGWLAPSLVGEPMVAREISEQALEREDLTYRLATLQPASSQGGFSIGGISPFFSVMLVLWIFSLMRRRR